MPAGVAPAPDEDLAESPDPVRAAAAVRVVKTPELAPFARLLLDMDVAGGLADANWEWIATGDVAAVAAWLARVQAGKLWPERED